MIKHILKIIKNILLTFIAIVFVLSFFDERRLGKGFVFHDSISIIEYNRRKDSLSVYIPREIKSYRNTKKYILAKQKPLMLDGAGLEPHFDYPYGRDSVYYWFIDKDTKKVIGPLLYSDMMSFLMDAHQEQMLIQLNDK